MKMNATLVLPIILLALALAASQPALAQTGDVSSTVDLGHFNVQASYPAEVLPGNSVTVHIQAKAKSSFNLVSLTLAVYYADGSSLRQVTSATLASNTHMNSGQSVNKDVLFTVPSSVPRTSLIALFSESVRVAYYDYYYYPAVYYYPVNYSYPYWYYDYYYYPYMYYYAYPSASYSTTTDDELSALSYVKATTPEYVSLQSQYDTLQQNLQQVQADNQKLQQDLNAAQSTITQKDAQIADLNQQLDSAKATGTTIGVAALALVAVVVIVAVVAVMRGRSKGTSKTTTELSPTTPEKPNQQ